MATDGAMQLSEYLETPESAWLYREIEGQPDDYPVNVQLPGSKNPVLIMTDAGTIRYMIMTMVDTIEAELLDEGDESEIP